MVEKLKQLPPEAIVLRIPDDGDLQPIEEGIREIWREFWAGSITEAQRIAGLTEFMESLPEKIVEGLSRPIDPGGETRLMQIAAEEIAAFKREQARKRSSKGMRRHIRRVKADTRREGRLPPKF